MSLTHPPARRSADEQLKVEAALVEMFQRRIRFNQTLGLTVHPNGSGPPTVRFDMRTDLIGHYQYGRLHGGVISAVLDATAGVALMFAVAERHAGDNTEQVLARFSRMGTIDLRIDYLRQGLGKHFIASAEVLRMGGRLASTTMRLVNDEGTLIASGAASFILN